MLTLRGALAVATVATVLLAGAGCGAGEEYRSAGKQDANAPLEIWTRRTPGSAVAKTTERLAAAFTKKTGIPTKVTSIFDGFETKLQQRAQAKDLPDLVMNDAAQLGTLVSQGLVREVKRDEIAGAGDITDRAWKAARAVDGKYYAVPTTAHAFALFVRSDWRKKVGAPEPKTWDDLVALGKAFADKDPDGNGKKDTTGFVIPGSTSRGYASWYWSTFLWQAGGDYFTEKDGKFASAIGSDQAITAARWFQDLFCRHKLVQAGAVTHDTNAAHQFWESGKAGIYLTGPHLMARFDKSLGKDKFEVLPPPAGPGGDASLAEGSNVYLMAGSVNESGQKQFAEFAASVEGQEIGMAGDTDGLIVRLPINSKVQISRTRNDDRWVTLQRIYDKSGVYVPTVKDWTPFRQMSAETLNALAAECSADPAQRMKDLSRKFDTELERQDIRAG